MYSNNTEQQGHVATYSQKYFYYNPYLIEMKNYDESHQHVLENDDCD